MVSKAGISHFKVMKNAEDICLLINTNNEKILNDV